MRVLIVFIILFNFPGISNAQWERVTDIPIGRMNDYCINGSKVDITIDNKIYRSTNSGVNWSLLYTGGERINAVETDGDTIYAGMNCQGLARSTNNGLNWVTIVPNWCYWYTFLKDGNRLFAGRYAQQGIMISSNNGMNWTNTSALGYSPSIFKFDEFFLAGSKPGILKSTDSGLNWRTTLDLFEAGEVPDIKKVGADFIASCWVSGVDRGRIYKSSNQGENWSLILQATGTYNNFFSIVIKNSSIYASCSGNGIYKSTNNGATWFLVNQGIPNIAPQKMFELNGYLFVDFNTQFYKCPIENVISSISNYSSIVKGFELYQNYPNPFNPATTIKFEIQQKSFVKLTVFDLKGQEIKTLMNEDIGAGSYQVSFDGKNLSSGLYIYKIESNGVSDSKKMLLIK